MLPCPLCPSVAWPMCACPQKHMPGQNSRQRIHFPPQAPADECILQAALCAALGGVASYAYVAWLCADVDRLSPTDDIPMIRANNIRDAWPRRFARLVAGLRQQLQPRLLVRCCPVWHLQSETGCCCIGHSAMHSCSVQEGLFLFLVRAVRFKAC